MFTFILPRLVQIGRLSGTWEDACVSLFLVLFGGLMSGLTLGLMSLDLVELEVLQRSGTPAEQKQALAVLPVIKKQHQLLVTLVLCNAIAMEALPVFLDNMVSTLVAVILSVTFVLAFGEVIPQAICSRNGLAIGANLGWLVRILMIICFPVAYPVGKLLDLVLGHNSAAMFRRPQLKAFVSMHSKEEGKGGELSIDETTIINGALDLTLKTAAEAMTPIDSTFSIDVDAKLDWETLGRILATGYSRVPVYSGDKRNLMGLILVKSLITLRAEDETPVSAVCIRRLPRVTADTPLYDMLNEFQRGQSHMAAVVQTMQAPTTEGNNVNGEAVGDHLKPDISDSITSLSKKPLPCAKGVRPVEAGACRSCAEWKVDMENGSSQACREVEKNSVAEARTQAGTKCFCNAEGEVIGIITLEDVFEELIQEEIVDETDEYIDVHKRIKVNGACTEAATSNGQHVGLAVNGWCASLPRIARAIGKDVGSPEKMNMKEGKRELSKAVYDLTEPLLDKR